jgi:hypothetical protein
MKRQTRAARPDWSGGRAIENREVHRDFDSIQLEYWPLFWDASC